MKSFRDFLTVYLLLLCVVATDVYAENTLSRQEKVLICGVCKNVAQAVSNTIANIEALGSHFADYAVIIYENNSTDNTVALFSEWTKCNSHVHFLSETLFEFQLPYSRTERIARARNIVLNLARNPIYHDFHYLIMVDLDFLTPWPIDEILNTLEQPIKWDCVSANGLTQDNFYWDRYAYRNKTFPLGPEMLGDDWWSELSHSRFNIQKANWIPVYSAFGGLAIYKMASIINFSYSGTVTKDMHKYYKNILASLRSFNHQLQKYLKMNGLNINPKNSKIPIIFRHNTAWEHSMPNYPYVTCCEHISLHASMSIHGLGKFYINPKMCMHY